MVTSPQSTYLSPEDYLKQRKFTEKRDRVQLEINKALNPAWLKWRSAVKASIIPLFCMTINIDQDFPTNLDSLLD